MLHLGVFGYALQTFISMPASMPADLTTRDPSTTPQWALLLDVMAVLAIVLLRVFTALVPLVRAPWSTLAGSAAVCLVLASVASVVPALPALWIRPLDPVVGRQ